MASPNIYTNGVGGATGDALTTIYPLYASGRIWYLHHTGADGVSPAGLDRSAPLATLAQAVTNAGTDDIIVCLSGHQQTLAASQSLAKRLSIVSEGLGSYRAKFTNGIASATHMLDASFQVYLGNLYFPASTASGASRVRLASTGCVMSGCYFECGASDTTGALQVTSDQTEVVNTSFVVTAAGGATQTGLTIAGACAGFRMDSVAFDGGTVGWGLQYGFNGANAISNIRATNISLLNGSDATMATGTSGLFHVLAVSGSSRVVWVA